MKTLLTKYIAVLLSFQTFSTYGLECTGLTKPTVQTSPTLVYASDVQEDFLQNEKITLYCCFKSLPAVNVSWSKDNRLIVPGVRYKISENNQVLTIFKSEKSDTGSYRCEGSNKHGRLSHDIMVKVHRPKCRHTPDIHSEHSVVKVKLGESVQLKCNVVFDPSCEPSMPSLFWKNSRRQVESSKGNSSIRKKAKDDVTVMELTIKHVKKSHGGYHTCVVLDLNGKKSSNVSLIVL